MNGYGLTPQGEMTLTLLMIVGLILSVLWICLPFAVFGIKRRLEDQAALLRLILTELQRQGGHEEMAPAAPETCQHDFQPPYPPEISRCTKCGILKKNA